MKGRRRRFGPSGLTIVYTGDGKGKTTAALGAAVRALGHGMRVLMIQFIKEKGSFDFGEKKAARSLKGLEFLQFGKGFVNIMGDSKPIAVHRQAAAKAIRTAKQKIGSGRYDVVVLDEIICALGARRTGLIKKETLLELIRRKPAGTHLILTGRGAPRWLIRKADLVTEMRPIKHPFQRGILAQQGIDY
jgi:cob(I)alamin adenosyltransferase